MKFIMKFHDTDHYEEIKSFGFDHVEERAFPVPVPRIGESVTNVSGRRRKVKDVVYDYSHTIQQFQVGATRQVPVVAILVTVGDDR